MTNEQLVEVAKRELRAIDRRFLFWVALGVETASGSGASAADVDWETFDWRPLRDALDDWLDGLPTDTHEVAYPWPINENLRLRFIATPRTASAIGYRPLPSFKLADPDPLPPVRFENGDTASLDSLPIDTVRDLAIGSKRLAVELVSHREAWKTLYELMSAMGKSNTSELNSLELEAHAVILGLVEDPPSPLGSFDEGWRAVHGLDVPMYDDPRGEEHG